MQMSKLVPSSLSQGYLPGFLKPETVTALWKIAANTEGQGHKDGGYGLGWVVIPEKQDFGACHHQSETILHGGTKIQSHPERQGYVTHSHTEFTLLTPPTLLMEICQNTTIKKEELHVM